MDPLPLIKKLAGDDCIVFSKQLVDDTMEYTVCGWTLQEYTTAISILNRVGFSASIITQIGLCSWRQKKHTQHKIYII